MPQTSIAPSPPEKKLLPKHWHALWLEKTKNACRKHNLKKTTAAGFGDFVSRFLQPFTCHPEKIPVSVIPEFLGHFGKTEKQAKFCRDALLFFYSNVVPSEKHYDYLINHPLQRQPTIAVKQEPQQPLGIIPGKSISIPTPALKNPRPIYAPEKSKIPIKNQKPIPQPTLKPAVTDLENYLKRMHLELKARNYSQRTIKNYGASVHQYLIWLKKDPSESDVPEIKNFQIYLKDDKKYSPRTVNLVTAAVQFFYIQVLGLKLPVEILPRMKTGRQLTKVYSEQQVEAILKAPTNLKHRLILMLAYGCGLRLEEVRTVQSNNFDFEKHLLRLQQGKGQKDCIVMLDPLIAEAVQAFATRR